MTGMFERSGKDTFLAAGAAKMHVIMKLQKLSPLYGAIRYEFETIWQ
jgi:hypothetical protein